MAILSSRDFPDLVPNVGESIGTGIGDLISQRIANSLQGKALSGDTSALATLAGRDPARGRAVGSILQNERDTAEQQRKLAEEQQNKENTILGSVARGFENATDKKGFLIAAQSQLAGQFPQLAEEIQDDIDRFDASPESVIQEYSAARSIFAERQDLTSQERQRQALLKDLKSKDDEVRKSAEVALGLTGRALSLTAEEAGKREAAKLGAQKGKKAEIAAEVKIAQEQAKLDVKAKFQAEENIKTFKVFEIALDNLTKSLGGTSLTGPFAGRIPATTTASQIAESAKAVMLPTLKQIFRQAGEGTFTDADQRALEGLLPSRKQTKAAQLATMDVVEKIVRAKLGILDDASLVVTDDSADTQQKIIRVDF